MLALKILLAITGIQAMAGMYQQNAGLVWRASVMHGICWWAYCTVPA